MAYQQRCIVCKKNMVLITNFRQRPVCAGCEMKDLSDPITSPKWRKFFDIDPGLYLKSSFLRSIKRNYVRQGAITAAQKEMFLKVVKEGAEGPKNKKPRDTRIPEPTEDVF